MRPTMSALAGLAAAALACVGCSDGGYVVVVRFDPASIAADVDRVDVTLVASCASQGGAGVEPVGAVESIAVDRAGGGGTLGDVPPGNYGIYARAWSRACRVMAAGCADVTLAAGGEGELVVTARGVAGPGCPAGTACTDAVCRSLDAGVDAAARDAGAPDAAAGDAGQRDAGMDSGLVCRCAACAPCDATGACVPNDARCGAGQTCDPVAGCVTPVPCPDGGVPTSCWTDADRDDFAPAGAMSTMVCAAAAGACPAGTTNTAPAGRSVDCNDTSISTHPGATELCNLVDDDCSAATVDGADEPTRGTPCDGADADSCTEGSLQCTTGAMRCDDMTSDTVEICNGLDDDCNGTADDPFTVCGLNCFGRVNPANSHRYVFCRGPSTWAAAQTACTALGTRLARIDDAAEDAWVFATAETAGMAINEYFIGATDAAVDGTWIWTDGDQFWSGTATGMTVAGRYANWDLTSQPNGGIAQNCAEVRTGTLGRWADTNCDASNGHVCEQY